MDKEDVAYTIPTQTHTHWNMYMYIYTYIYIYIYIMGYYSAVKMTEILSFATTSVDLEGIMQVK